MMPSESSESIGVTFSAMAFISSLPSASRILKNTPTTLSSSAPVRSRAAIVFSKVGASGLATIAAISALFSAMAFSKAGI